MSVISVACIDAHSGSQGVGNVLAERREEGADLLQPIVPEHIMSTYSELLRNSHD